MNTYPSHEYLQHLKAHLNLHLLSSLPAGIKPKREAQIKKAYGNTYSIQVGSAAIVGAIETSHLLGMNDVIIPHIINEYAELNFALRKLETELKTLKQFNEISEGHSQLGGALKTKDIGKFLYDDLAHAAQTHNIEVDLKQCMATFKQFEPSSSFLLQLGLPTNK